MLGDYDAYFRQLLERVNLAVKVPFREVRLNAWEPKISDCHGNVDYWVQRHPEANAVQGWLFWGQNEAGQYRIIAHSVLDESGSLVDITPIDQKTPRDGLRFLRHLGREEDFSAMNIPCSEVLYPPINVEEWQTGQVAALEEATDSEYD